MSVTAGRRDPFLGLVLDGKYEVTALLARGGMGRVYRAKQRSLGRDVALKVLDLELLDAKAKGADFARRFFLEAAAGAKLRHPNTVVVYDYGQASDDVFYIAMELLEGRTLGQILTAETRLAPTRVKHIALQICGSIGEAHELGMVHRDVKPSNVMLSGRGADPDFVKVLDFGLVKQADDAGLTQSGALLGTPRYIAPEQIGSSDVGPESDVYSLGACLYHCLTGRPPFESDSKFVLLASHMNDEPPAIHEVSPDSPVSPELAAVVMRCLRKDPTTRFRSMPALVDALLATPEPTTAGRSSLPSASSPGLSRPGLSGPGLSGPGLSGPGLSGPGLSGPGRAQPALPTASPGLPSSVDRSGVHRSHGSMSSTSAGRLTSAASAALFASSQTAPSQGAPSQHVLGQSALSASGSLVDDPKRAVPVTLVAVLLGALMVVGGWWAFREPSTSQSPELSTSSTSAPRPSDVPAANVPAANVPAGTAEALGAPAPGAGPVVLVVTPPGARVRRGEADLGDAPISLPVPPGETWTLRLEAPGYAPREVTVLGGQGEARVALSREASTTRRSRGRRGPGVAPPSPRSAGPELSRQRDEPARDPSPRTDNRDPWAR